MNSNFILDSSNESLREALKEGVFLIKPNLHEFQQLIGEKISTEKEIIQKAQEIIRNNECSYIVISLGAAGLLFISKNQAEHISSPLVPIKSRVGAGDSMVAGITLSLAQGKTIEEAVRFGLAAGAAAVMTPGTELCRRSDAERIYETLRLQCSQKIF